MSKVSSVPTKPLRFGNNNKKDYINDNNIILIIKRIILTDIVLKIYHRYLRSMYVLWKNYCSTFDKMEIIILNLKNHSKKV